MALGVVGEYVARIFEEAKIRPYLHRQLSRQFQADGRTGPAAIPADYRERTPVWSIPESDH